jgi:hypothetical protein
MRPFAALAAGTCPPHEEMLLAVAAELGPYDVRRVSDAIGSLAAALPEPEAAPAAQLEAVAALVHDALTVDVEGALLLPDVLRTGTGHAAGVTAALGAACARRGISVDVVGHGTQTWLAHPDAAPLVVDPVRGEVVDGRGLEADLAWRCAHELAHVTLALLTERAERDGDLGLALHAAELGSRLPLDGSWPAGPTATLSRVRARLN